MTKMTNKYISLVCDGVTYHETGIDISWSSSRGFGHLTFGLRKGKPIPSICPRHLLRLPELWINKTTLIFGKSLDNLPEKFF